MQPALTVVHLQKRTSLGTGALAPPLPPLPADVRQVSLALGTILQRMCIYVKRRALGVCTVRLARWGLGAGHTFPGAPGAMWGSAFALCSPRTPTPGPHPTGPSDEPGLTGQLHYRFPGLWRSGPC